LIETTSVTDVQSIPLLTTHQTRSSMELTSGTVNKQYQKRLSVGQIELSAKLLRSVFV